MWGNKTSNYSETATAKPSINTIHVKPCITPYEEKESDLMQLNPVQIKFPKINLRELLHSVNQHSTKCQYAEVLFHTYCNIKNTY